MGEYPELSRITSEAWIFTQNFQDAFTAIAKISGSLSVIIGNKYLPKI
ncbi:hypothetical protein IQ247_05740 [Plectonema cf. radiosum LEGE 06105]|uniref:Uncharacterized protein n=1 Tax=Plectonema cf. radiosum LEGE 06105 TaxID=945769 RepID=A0A8J7K1S8_9CYAN|nr:hypothetical protein [Plectonema radiosum]MBE9212217.1 hypothetical protein [Plectonema cf. radiosum LEGE 06105]